MNKLFIYIPTYNRPIALKTQLSVLLPQISQMPEHVRILVSDNASDKPLEEFQEKYSSFPNIQFRSNSGNIGANANIALGFVFAKPNEFLWILSDNDIVTETALDYILGMLDSTIDFYCFNYSVKEPTVADYKWENGCQTSMDWRLGLISDALYNVNSIKKSIDAAFYYHNSSFPHLAVAFSAMKKKSLVKYKLLPREKINNAIFDSTECPTDYSLAHVCMPLLVPLFPAKEAKSFSLNWLHKHGVDFYRNRKSHYHLYLQSKATLAYYGGWKANVLLMWNWPVYITAIPLMMARPKLVSIAKKYLSSSAIERLNKLREKV
jgi:glycosyltransferase involved in cell wall biosynthesis